MARTKPPKRQARDYRREYLKRIALAQSRGVSRSVGRGHARAGERPPPKGLRLINPKLAEERAVRLVAKGSSLRAAASAEGLTVERLRRYLKENTDARYEKRRWVIADSRPRQFPFYSRGRLVSPWVDLSAASEAAKYMHVVGLFLPSGEEMILLPYVGRHIRDIRGQAYQFETDPNTLYRLDSSDELDYPEMYKIVSVGAE